MSSIVRVRLSLRSLLMSAPLVFLGACAGTGESKSAFATVPNVDLQRYQGPWYIVASIPESFEKQSFDGVESYAVNPDGTIATVYQFRKGAFDGEQKTITGSATVAPDSGNAIWKVQVIWPFTGDYRITYLADDYSVAIVGQESRDHVWVLSRKPEISDKNLAPLTARIANLGYDMTKYSRTPQNGAHP